MNGVMTDGSRTQSCTSTGDVNFLVKHQRDVAAVDTVFRSTESASGLTDHAKHPGRRSFVPRDARTDAGGPRVLCRLVLCFTYLVVLLSLCR